MTRIAHTTRLLATAALALTLTLVNATVSNAAKPIKEILSAYQGWEVNATAHRNYCTIESGDTCQPGALTSQVGGFEYPHAIAVNNDQNTPPGDTYHGDIYVADNTHRIQIYSPTGQFVSMFGARVNKTTGANTCTAEEIKTGATECQPGATGPEPGYFNSVDSIAVDPANGHVYVAENMKEPGFAGYGERIQELTASGEFILEIGQEVNKTTKGNVCTAVEEEHESVTCGGPVEHPYGNRPGEANAPTKEHDAFSFTNGTVLSVGGPEDLLYVGECGRVQELASDGTFKHEIGLEFITTLPESEVKHVAVDGNGDVYLVYYELYEVGLQGRYTINEDPASKMYGFDPSGHLVSEFKLTPREPESRVEAEAIAFDSSGRLALIEFEQRKYSGSAQYPSFTAQRSGLYDAGAGRLHLISELIDPARSAGPTHGGVGSGNGMTDVSFGDDGRMYAAFWLNEEGGPPVAEVIGYSPAAIGELVTSGVLCSPGVVVGSSVRLDCALHGEVNPWGVSGTEVWFEWGATGAFGSLTAVQPVSSTGETLLPVSSAPVRGLVPDSTIHYRLAGHDAPVQAPEELTGEPVVSRLPSVPPRVVGSPQVRFASPFSAVFYGLLNPENTSSEYYFEYEACSAGGVCSAPLKTNVLHDGTYGQVGVTLEAKGLQPSTTYRYRLVAVNGNGEAAVNENGGLPVPEGQFTTAPAPVPQATSGQASDIGANTAVVSGSVNPDGQPAVYRFELGVYAGTETQYGVLLSSPAGSGSSPVQETAGLSGLQPGTVYAYRISISSAYGTAYGSPVLFTTLGLPAVIPVPVSLPLLGVPQISFPPSTPIVTPRHVVKHSQRKKSKRRSAGKHRHRNSVSRHASHAQAHKHKPGKGHK